MSDEIHIGDDGSLVRFTIREEGVVVNLSTATVIEAIIERKDRTTFVETLEVWGDPANGQAYFYTSGEDITVKGDWKAQVYIEFPSGSWHCEVVEFKVLENLARPEV